MTVKLEAWFMLAVEVYVPVASPRVLVLSSQDVLPWALCVDVPEDQAVIDSTCVLDTIVVGFN